jgi:hypothetical protein
MHTVMGKRPKRLAESVEGAGADIAVNDADAAQQKDQKFARLRRRAFFGGELPPISTGQSA